MSRTPLLTAVGEYAAATVAAVRAQAADEWRRTPMHRSGLSRPPAKRLAADPADFRPIQPETGRALLAGRLTLAGAVLDMGVGGDPWDTPSPTRRFAVELHRFAWLPSLLTLPDGAGVREALRLTLDWGGPFGRYSPFAWSGETLERRVYNLACGLKLLAEAASEAETARLVELFARQVRFLAALDEGPLRAAERTAVAAIGAATLEPAAGAALLTRMMARLPAELDRAVLPDGGHRSRSPQAGLELLLDLLTLNDALEQRGRAAPAAMSRALDRLTAAARFFTLSDGRLVGFQGGESAEPERVRAARVLEPADAAPPFAYAPHAGYQRLTGRTLQVMIDAAAPAAGAWSATACAQPLAIEIAAGSDRLVVNAGWSPDAAGPQALRLAGAGSTAQLGEASPGWPLRGFRARKLGARLICAPDRVEVRRNEDAGDNVWIEAAHDGWARTAGYRHERRLYLDAAADELRGEDAFTPAARQPSQIPYAVRFHLHPDARATLSRDGRSVLIQGASGRAWWLRSDAGAAALEPSAQFIEGLPRRTSQVVLRGQVRPPAGARVRWKLSPVDAVS